jgi:AraC-like DNA-binding protein
MSRRTNNLTSGCNDSGPVANATIAAGFADSFLEFAVARGADRDKLLALSGIRAEDLAEKDTRVPLARYVAMLKLGIALCGEPALALQFGESVHLPEISIAGLLGSGITSMEDGCRQMNRFARLMVDDDEGDGKDRFEIIRRKGDVLLRFTSRANVEHPLLTESGFARAVCGTRAMLAAAGLSRYPPFPKAIHFTHAEPAYRGEYDRIFGVPLLFGSNVNAFVIGAEFLSMSLPQRNPYLSGIVTAHAEALLERLESTKTARGRVESLLAPMLPTGAARMGTIARKIGVSRQTLLRRLKTEGVTFEQVLDGLRKRLALESLREKKRSVSETASMLGYSDPAAFSRAFKRWTGTSPRAAVRPATRANTHQG